MFEIYNLDKSFTPQYVKGRGKIANVSIQLMDFNQKVNRLETFNFNVKPCLHNEIKSKSCVNNEFGIGHDAGHMFNLVCSTQIIFKDYLKYKKIKVNELQVIINDLYHHFLRRFLQKSHPKKTSSKSSSKKQIVISSTMTQNATVNTINNNSNSVEDNVEETGIINKKINNPLIENDGGAETKQKNIINLVTVNNISAKKEQKKSTISNRKFYVFNKINVQQ